jgi:hypothetical protein
MADFQDLRVRLELFSDFAALAVAMHVVPINAAK